MIPLPVLQNIAFLLAAAAIFDLTTHKLQRRPHWVWQILSGLILGLIGIGVMLTPWTIESGIVLDTRSILISVVGLFFGTIAVVVTMAVTIICRIIQGGIGATTGVYVIFASGLIGLIWRYWRKDLLTGISALELYLLGIVVHTAMLLLMLTLPGNTGWKTLTSMVVPVMLAYPLGTTVFGILLRERLERLQNIAAIAESRETLSKILNTVPQGIFWKDANGRYLGCNQIFARSAGLKMPDEIIGKTDLELPWPKDYAENYRAIDLQVVSSGQPRLQYTEILHQADGNQITTVTSKVPLINQHGEIFGILGVFGDITELKKIEAEQIKLREQLYQATKMESIGRLAGGVAHDFNNMLGVILGFTEMSMRLVDPSTTVYKHLQEVCRAAERSSDLTRQLLAFARKQTVNPELLDINKTIEGMLKILTRLIGEHIRLVWEPTANLGAIKIDPSQLDQILANLCANARDAIGKTGMITITTGALHADAAFCRNLPESYPGDFIVLSITDSGCGIDEKTIGQLFEPFFTTKEFGTGTGLGLATVYGIVKQNHGFIKVTSQPGKGTCFKIFLPDHGPANFEEPVTSTVLKPVAGHETILLVEDEEAILTITSMMLEAAGYRVITASSPSEAIKAAQNSQCKVQLLLSDVVMPGMNGKEMAERLKEMQPGLKCLFMSGYTADVIARQDLSEESLNFLAKPFNSEELTRKVREVLDQQTTPGSN